MKLRTLVEAGYQNEVHIVHIVWFSEGALENEDNLSTVGPFPTKEAAQQFIRKINEMERDVDDETGGYYGPTNNGLIAQATLGTPTPPDVFIREYLEIIDLQT